MEADVVEGGVVQAVLVLLHLGLDAADSSVAALLAPAAVLSPGGAGPLQRGVAAAAELDVVDGRVVAEQTLVGLHADLEGGERARGAVHGVGPLTEAGENREECVNEEGMWRRSSMWAGKTLEGLEDPSTSKTPHSKSWQRRCVRVPPERVGKLAD